MGDVTTVLWPNRVNKNALQKAFADALGIFYQVRTVSAVGLGTAGVQAKNNGAQYGPDTAGTTTCGINEAIASLPTGDLTSRWAGGGTIALSQGVYTCSGQISVPNAGAFNLRVEGSGKVATILKYTGAAASFITSAVDSVVGPPGSCSLNCTWRGIGFTHVTATSATILMRLHAANEVDIDDCLFCPDDRLATGGNCLNYTPGGSVVKTVGVELQGCNQQRIRNSAFWGCARGATLLGDHARVENTIFDGCNDTNSNYTFSTDGTNYFPKSYGVLFGVSGFEAVMRGVHFDGCTNCVVSARLVMNENPLFESCTNTSVIDGTNGGTVTVINPMTNLPSDMVDKKFDNAGTFTAVSDGAVVNYFSANPVLGIVTDMLIANGVTVWTRALYGRVTGSDATTAGQSLTNVTGLSVGLDPSGVYEFEAVMSVTTSAVTTGTKYGVQFDQSGAAVEGQVVGSLSTSATQSERVSALNTAGLAYLTTSGQSGQILIKGIVTTGVNGGNLTVQHLKVTSGTSTVKVNSYLKATRIA